MTYNSPAQTFLCDEGEPVQQHAPVASFLCDDVEPARAPAATKTPAPAARLETRPVVYGDRRSGNCFKVASLIDYLNLDVEWREVDIFEGENAEEEFLSLNPFGKVPALKLSSGAVIAESNAILHELARGTVLEPQTDEARAEVYQWLFWEASAFTPPLAQRRWCVTFIHKAEEDIDPKLFPKGNIALSRLNEHLAEHDYLAGNRLSIADFALYGFGHAIEEGGWRAQDFPAVSAWIDRVAADIAQGRPRALAAE